MKINQILRKTYKTNQEKGHYKLIFELKICKKITEFYQYFGLIYATIRYGCKMKNDRQKKCNKNSKLMILE